MLARRAEFEIKRVLKSRFSLSHATCERYLSRAREVLAKRFHIETKRRVMQAQAFYESVIRDPKARAREKIRAQKRLDSLFGLTAPTKVAFTDARGEHPSPADNTTAILLTTDEGRELLARVTEYLGGIQVERG
jgi:hypothetical protein